MVCLSRIFPLPAPWLALLRESRSSSAPWPSLALVSPVRIDVYVADPDAIGYIFARRKDFVRPVENYAILNVFGPNITSADNNNWPRHRKALAAPFNESIMRTVWNETSKQAHAVARVWSKPEALSTGIISVTKDIRQLSLNVLAAVSFGKSYDFSDSASSAEEEEKLSYRTALQTVLDNAILLMLMPYGLLGMSAMPENWKRIGRAGEAFRRYMIEMLDAETKAIKDGKPGASGVIASLVHALDAYQTESTADSTAKGLSVEEVFGNTFVINFAGHDTTANTLAFATLLLAGHLSVQQWVSEEIQQATSGLGPQEWTYETLFEKLPRCRAVLFETVRMYPTTFSVPKGTEDEAHVLKIQGRSISLPPRTGVMLNMYAAHHDPAVWSDATTWRPSRWVVPVNKNAGKDETLWQPPPNTYFPWSDGQQNCPGRKFAEVEFVAVIACLLRDHRLRVKRHEGETHEASLARLTRTINDVDFQVLSRMKDPDQIRLLYERV